MSGILGLIQTDDRPVSPQTLTQMAATLTHRGPDGIHTWHQGPVGLGHLLLCTTPESQREHMPWVDPAANLVLTADVRLDNRSDLIHHLTLAPDCPDSHILLAAYQKWGARCPEYLLGDFAFALWDGRHHHLFCARDHLGVRPFFYHHSPTAFIFASEIKALLCLPEVPQQLYEPWVATHLTLVECHDPGTTFYQDIWRLLPGHRLLLTPHGPQVEPYWQLDPTRQIQLESDQAYAEAFADLFTAAVRCRLHTTAPIGTMLSGGLDSSAVTSVAQMLRSEAAQPPLQVFSAYFTGAGETDERPFMDAVLALGDYPPEHLHRLDGNQVNLAVTIDPILQQVDEPFWYAFLGVNWELYQIARSQGVRVLLDGIDGDTTVADCHVSYLGELLRTGRWRQFSVEIEGMAQRSHQSYGRCLQQYALNTLIKPSLRQYWKRWRNQPQWRATTISPAFARRMQVNAKFQAQGGYPWDPALTARAAHHRWFTLYPPILELLNKSSAAFGIEYRHPFTDKRLVEFCLALPGEQKFHQGITRVVMRRGLAQVLPELVQNRSGKGITLHHYVRSLLTAPSATDVHRQCQALDTYLDRPVVQEIYHRYLTSTPGAGVLDVWYSTVLDHWLRLQDP